MDWILSRGNAQQTCEQCIPTGHHVTEEALGARAFYVWIAAHGYNMFGMLKCARFKVSGPGRKKVDIRRLLCDELPSQVYNM